VFKDTISCQGQERVELYFLAQIHLHGGMIVALQQAAGPRVRIGSGTDTDCLLLSRELPRESIYRSVMLIQLFGNACGLECRPLFEAMVKDTPVPCSLRTSEGAT
jgi:hypothetical protein